MKITCDIGFKNASERLEPAVGTVSFNKFSSILAAPGWSRQEGLCRVMGEDFSRNEQV